MDPGGKLGNTVKGIKEEKKTTEITKEITTRENKAQYTNFRRIH